MVPSLFKKIKKLKGKSILLDNLNHYRDFISTEDICSAIELVLKKKVTGTLNIGVGKKIKLLKIASYFCKKFKVKLLNRVNQKPTFFISNNKKLKNEGWKSKNNFFYELRKFK